MAGESEFERYNRGHRAPLIDQRITDYLCEGPIGLSRCQRNTKGALNRHTVLWHRVYPFVQG